MFYTRKKAKGSKGKGFLKGTAHWIAFCAILVYDMKANDTFWGIYGRLLQDAPQLATKSFTFQLESGHKLTESEFDWTLRSACNVMPARQC